MVTITADKAEAAATRASVEAQEAEANAQAATARELAADAQRDLDEALPALDAALASLKNLSRCGRGRSEGSGGVRERAGAWRMPRFAAADGRRVWGGACAGCQLP